MGSAVAAFEFLAVVFGVWWLALLAGAFGWMALYEYTKGWFSEKPRLRTPTRIFGAVVFLLVFGFASRAWIWRSDHPRIHITEMKIADKVMGPTPFLNIDFLNKGTASTSIQPSYLTFFLEQPRSHSDLVRLEDYFSKQVQQSFLKNEANTFSIVAGGSGRFTAMREPLNKEQLRQLFAANHVMYFVGTIRYSDGSSEYATNFCVYVQGASDAVFYCNGHNEEHVPVTRRR